MPRTNMATPSHAEQGHTDIQRPSQVTRPLDFLTVGQRREDLGGCHGWDMFIPVLPVAYA